MSVERPVPILLSCWLLHGGGTETQVRQTARALDPKQFDVHVVVFRPNEAQQRELIAAGIKTEYLPVNNFKSLHTLKMALRLRRYMRANRIRLVHAFDTPTATFVLPVARLSGVDVILSSQRGHPHLLEPVRLKVQRLVEKAVSDGTVVNTEVLSQVLEKEGIPKERIRICPNGLDTRQYQFGKRCYPPELAGARAVIGCIAAQRVEKNLPFLVDTFAAIRRDRPGLKLLLVGSGPAETEIQARVKANGLENDCVLVPHTNDVPRWMSAIDVFVLCSESEGVSNSLLEAMASGAAVVGSRVPGNRELIRDGVNGYLFEFGNAADLSEKVLKLVDDPELRAGLACSASAWVRDNMGLEVSATRMSAIYNEFLTLKVR